MTHFFFLLIQLISKQNKKPQNIKFHKKISSGVDAYKLCCSFKHFPTKINHQIIIVPTKTFFSNWTFHLNLLFLYIHIVLQKL